MARLDQLVARNLGLSRSVTTKIFRQKRVRSPEGDVLDAKQKVDLAALPLQIVIDRHLETLYAAYHVMLHKPAGCVTAMKDKLHPVAWDLVADLPLAEDLRPVGRLDLDTTGLLLWTTDGDLLHRMTHPKRAVTREYHVALAGPWRDPPGPDEDPIELDDGHRPNIVQLEALDAEACHPALQRPASAQRWATITLTSGKFHEVKRIFVALGTEVVALARVRHGPIWLPEDLDVGQARALDLPALFDG